MLRIGDQLLDGFPVENGIRQGCTMAPVLLNIYMCAVVDQWRNVALTNPEVGIDVMSHRSDQLFNARLSAASSTCATEFQFADDGALLAKTWNGAQSALQLFIDVATSSGLRVNAMKTKFIAVGTGVHETDVAPLRTSAGDVQHVTEFTYLGCLITPDGTTSADVTHCIAAASKAFGRLCKPVFNNRDLPVSTKQNVYTATVLSALLYGSETWTPLQWDVHRLEVFHNQCPSGTDSIIYFYLLYKCLRTIFDIRGKRQQEERLSSSTVRTWWGDTELVTEKIIFRRPTWLGHVIRMSPERLPRLLLFGSLTQTRPQHKPKKRWKDAIRADLKMANVKERDLCDATSCRSTWRSACREAVACAQRTRTEHKIKPVLSDTCGRSFSQPRYMTCHKCTVERPEPVREQSGTVQCNACGRWLLSRGGLANQRCGNDPAHSLSQPRRQQQQQRKPPAVQDGPGLTCLVCQRTFTSISGRTRHKCKLTDIQTTVAPPLECSACHRTLRSTSGRTRHRCSRVTSTI